MAETPKYNAKNIRSKLDQSDKYLDSLHNDTYFSSNQNRLELDDISNNIENKINALISRNQNKFDISGISNLYIRSMKQSGMGKDKENIIKDIDTDMRGEYGDDMLSTYLENKYLREFREEIDLVCKYNPRIEEAIDFVCDMVLNADSTSSKYIIPHANFSEPTETQLFTSRVNQLEDLFNIHTRIESAYKMASKYGDELWYCIPYSQAISQLLNSNRSINGARNFQESVNESFVTECMTEAGMTDNEIRSTIKEMNSYNINIKFDDRRVLESAILEYDTMNDIINESSSIFESDGSIITEGLDQTVPSDLKLPKDIKTAQDGFINVDDVVRPEELKVKGSILKVLESVNALPIALDDTVIGYYYFEFSQEMTDARMNTTTSVFGASANPTATANVQTRMQTLGYQSSRAADIAAGKLASKISTRIDKKFVNNNQDLVKDIYMILKQNEVFGNMSSSQSVTISFLPASDVHMLTFNKDPKTHRGVPDTAKGLTAAKIHTSILLNDTTGMLTRGQDKRVYYVKQTVDTNISQSLLNVINQIKKSNFNVRQYENLNNILNITGKYNDLFIPVGPNGDSPIQFEIMPGQQIESNTDLLNRLEEMTINPIVSMEMLQHREGIDFAAQVTSSNLKELRKCYKRQTIVKKFLSEVYTKLYNYQFKTNIKVDITLPPPITLNTNNVTQLLDTIINIATNLANMEYTDQNDPTIELQRAEFIREYVRSQISSYIQSDHIDKLKKNIELRLKSLPSENEDEE